MEAPINTDETTSRPWTRGLYDVGVANPTRVTAGPVGGKIIAQSWDKRLTDCGHPNPRACGTRSCAGLGCARCAGRISCWATHHWHCDDCGARKCHRYYVGGWRQVKPWWRPKGMPVLESSVVDRPVTMDDGEWFRHIARLAGAAE